MVLPRINGCRSQKIHHHQTSQQQPGQGRHVPQFCDELHEQTIDVIGEIEFLREIVCFGEVPGGG